MASPDTPADRAYVALAVERQQQRIDRAVEEMAGRASTSTEMTGRPGTPRSYARTRSAWMLWRPSRPRGSRRWLDGDPDEGRPTYVDQGQVSASAAGTSPASPPGPGPGQPNPRGRAGRGHQEYEHG